MPGGDRTGPRGQGPMAGRGRGWCGSSGGRKSSLGESGVGPGFGGGGRGSGGGGRGFGGGGRGFGGGGRGFGGGGRGFGGGGRGFGGGGRGFGGGGRGFGGGGRGAGWGGKARDAWGAGCLAASEPSPAGGGNLDALLKQTESIERAIMQLTARVAKLEQSEPEQPAEKEEGSPEREEGQP